MLSSASSNVAGRCIYCAFRSRQIALQSLRQKSTSTFFTKSLWGDDKKSSRLSDKRKGGRDRDAKPAFRYYGERDGERRDGDRDGKPAFRYHGERDGERRDGDSGFGSGTLHKTVIKDGKWRGAAPKANFSDALDARIKAMKEELKDAPVVEHLQKDAEREGRKADGFGKIWKNFVTKIRRVDDFDDDNFFASIKGHKVEDTGPRILTDLRKAYALRGEQGLDDRIKYAFYGHVTGAKFTDSDIKNQRALADLRYPGEWYPATRVMSRTVHLHVGPTNSGKTYHALQRLEQAQKGAYAGPLRLLAHEVYTRMSAKGKRCTLVTGEERRIPEVGEEGDASMTSCTVEMMPLNIKMDVAVIDEIQMIGNADRGWAWTQALLGVKAKEVHLCGEERTIPLIQEICASMRDELVIHRYQRLSPLKIADESLNGRLDDLRKGDCIVSFSVMGIHALRRQIERATGKKVATVYGSLPPETRAQQARLFNDQGNDYDYLVASDAVGMGLNLAIKRIIFESSTKFDGIQRRTLSVADIKQIAGRAGRYKTAAQANEQATAAQELAAAKGEPAPPTPPPAAVAEDTETVGLVTTLEKWDFPVICAAMDAEPEPIRTAGVFPPGTILERFSSYFPPGTPFSYVLTRLHELSLMHKRFHLCGLRDQVWIADLIEPVQGLSIEARNTLCASPASKTDMDLWSDLLPAYARVIAEQTGGDLLNFPELPLEVLDAPASASREYLRELERLHKGLVNYLWLSYRFAGIFTTRALAFHVKGLVEEKIEDVLGKFSFSDAQRLKIAKKREEDLLRGLDTAVLAEEDVFGVGADDVRVASEMDQSLVDADAAEIDDAERNSLINQTSLTSGGDRFGGEEDMQFEDPEELDAEIESTESDVKATTPSFAAWRAQQVRGESQGTPEEDDGASLGAAVAEGEEAGRMAAQREDMTGQAGSEEPAQAEADATADLEPGEMGGSSQVTPELEMPSEQPPLETQEVSPEPASGAKVQRQAS